MEDDWKEQGFNLFKVKVDLELEIEDLGENRIPIDLEVSTRKDFLDVLKDTAFKKSFSAQNKLVWVKEDYFDSGLFKIAEAS